VITEADTCRKYVLPKLYAAGWNDDQISEQKSFTDGRIIPVGVKGRRRPCKRADYLLRYARDFMLAVVEAKAAYKLPGDGCSKPKITRQCSALSSPIRPTAMGSCCKAGNESCLPWRRAPAKLLPLFGGDFRSQVIEATTEVGDIVKRFFGYGLSRRAGLSAVLAKNDDAGVVVFHR
jgi:hypothetical protein